MPNVHHCSDVRHPGDWCVFNDGAGPYIKAILPCEEPKVDHETAGDLRLICLPLYPSPGGWVYNGNPDKITMEPSIRTEICVGHTAETPPKPIMKEIWHGHLTNGEWRACAGYSVITR